MRKIGRIEVERMADEQLWRLLESRLCELERDIMHSLPRRDHLNAVRQAKWAAGELRMRGVQLRLY